MITGSNGFFVAKTSKVAGVGVDRADRTADTADVREEVERPFRGGTLDTVDTVQCLDDDVAPLLERIDHLRDLDHALG
jgi:hypothetical protein